MIFGFSLAKVCLKNLENNWSSLQSNKLVPEKKIKVFDVDV